MKQNKTLNYRSRALFNRRSSSIFYLTRKNSIEEFKISMLIWLTRLILITRMGQKHIYNPVEHIGWRLFENDSFLDVWDGFEYVSVVNVSDYVKDIVISRFSFISGKKRGSQCILIDIKKRCVWTTLHKKSSFPLRISSVNVTKSTGRIYWKNL